MRKLLLVATAALSYAVPSAAAPPATYYFNLTGAATFNWALPASPTPTTSDVNNFQLTGVNVNGVSSSFLFFNDLSGGGFLLNRGLTSISTNSATLFTGPTSAPTFTLGSFPMTSGPDNYNLTISATGAVPEPASWAMLIAGFGLTGAAMRRRRSAVAAA